MIKKENNANIPRKGKRIMTKYSEEGCGEGGGALSAFDRIVNNTSESTITVEYGKGNTSKILSNKKASADGSNEPLLAIGTGNATSYTPIGDKYDRSVTLEYRDEAAIAPKKKAPEHSGLDVDYYTVEVKNPKSLLPYSAECEDIMEALGMNFAEGSAFKSIWRSCAARTLGKLKKGGDSVRDAEKVVYYGKRMLEQRKNALQK